MKLNYTKYYKIIRWIIFLTLILISTDIFAQQLKHIDIVNETLDLLREDDYEQKVIGATYALLGSASDLNFEDIIPRTTLFNHRIIINMLTGCVLDAYNELENITIPEGFYPEDIPRYIEIGFLEIIIYKVNRLTTLRNDIFFNYYFEYMNGNIIN